jgi:hypothetical protein
MTNCDKSDANFVFLDSQEQESIIFSNPDYFKIKLKLEENIRKYDSINTISFEDKYGKPLYKSTVALDSEFKTLIIPLYNPETLALKGWMSCFYSSDNQINFMHSVADKMQIEIFDLTKGNLVLTDGKESKIVKPKNSNLARLHCGISYRYICGTIYVGDYIGETKCGYFYEGIRCVDIPEQLFENNDTGSTPWVDPFANNSGGTSPIICDPGYVKDINGNCVPKPCDPGYVKDVNGNCVKNPCIKVYILMNDQRTKDVYDILEGKVKEPREYGYSKKLDGNWSEGILGNNGHSIEIGSSNVGFLHTHSYNTGSIHMFSDTDIIKFLFQVKYAIDNGIDMSEVIGGMVSDSGTYVMSYDGSIYSDLAVLNGWTEAKIRDEYLRAFEKSGGDMTKLFYDFINKLGIKGITLNARQNDGTYKKTSLNSDGTTKNEDC